MTGAQSEYRYSPGESGFRITGFYGLAKIYGGVYGIDDRLSDDNGWDSEICPSLRYKLQQSTGVDLQLDFIKTSIGKMPFISCLIRLSKTIKL